MVDIVEPKPPLDAKAFFVCGAITTLYLLNLPAPQVIGDLAADAAEWADAVNRLVGLRNTDAVLVDHSRWQKRAGGAGLDAFAAGHAGRLTHGVVKVEDDL